MKAAAERETAFVPFGPDTVSARASTSAPTATLKVIPGEAAEKTFAPLTAAVLHGGADSKHGAPSISLQKEGDRITGVRIECGCGQVIELACDYGKSP